jgi:hypothetical protein
MRLMPGFYSPPQEWIDYAQGILHSLGPAGRILATLPFDALADGERAMAPRYVNDLVRQMKLSGEPEEALADVLLIALRFNGWSSDAWSRNVFEAALLPALQAFAANDMWWAVQRLCRFIGIICFHGARSDLYVQSMLSAMENALEPELIRWSKPPVAPTRPIPVNGLTVAIVTDFQLADRSGIELLMRFLEAYRDRFGASDRMSLVIERSGLTEPSAPYRARIEAAGVTVVPYDRSGSDSRTPVGFGNLASICAGLDPDAVVFYCSYCFALLAAWCRLAPVQAFWSVSFDARPSRHLELLLSSSAADDGGSTKTVAGQRWTAVSPIYPLDPHPVQPVRRDGPHATLGRPLFATVAGGIQRFANDDFIAMVARLLNAVPGSAFLCSAADDYQPVMERVHRFGIADRWHNLGWIDVDAFAPQIDVHLDSFPYGTGVSSLRMLAHGCPTVSMPIKESLYGYIYNPLLAHGWGNPRRQAAARALFFPPHEPQRLLVGRTMDEYVSLAVTVARDPDYRTACVEAYQRLFVELLRDGAYAVEAWRGALVSAVRARPG